jgi:predicted nucleic acid-binding protein
MKAVLDTNVLIQFFRDPDGKEEFEARTLRPQYFMSSVVTMELTAGCRTAKQLQELTSFLKPFEKAGRLITPDHGSFHEAGRVLAKMGAAGMPIAQQRRMLNDILIAVSAMRAGAVVITANLRHFGIIERHLPVRWMPPA